LTWTSLSDHHKWRGACRDNCENVIEFESHLRKTQKNTQNAKRKTKQNTQNAKKKYAKQNF
jgi:hypothetical protein